MSRTQLFNAKYKFTPEELAEMHKKLMAQLDIRDSIKLRKKQVVAQLNSESEECEIQISNLRSQLSAGYEYRQFMCDVYKDFTHKCKRFIYPETGEELGTEPLTAEDWQTSLDEDNVIAHFSVINPGDSDGEREVAGITEGD